MKTGLIGFLLVTGLLCGCAANPAREDSKDSKARHAAEINTQLGREYMQRNQDEVALEKLKKAISMDNNYAPAHTMIAVLYEKLGEENLAEKNYYEAVRIAPGNGDVNNNYGAYLCRNGKGQDAERYFLKALDDPFYKTPAVAMANAGACQLKLGNVDKAETYLRKSLGYDAKFPDALLAMASISVSRKDYLRGRAFLQRYESAGPRSAESLMLGYRIEHQLGNATGAKHYADSLLDYFPQSGEAKEIKGIRSQ